MKIQPLACLFGEQPKPFLPFALFWIPNEIWATAPYPHKWFLWDRWHCVTTGSPWLPPQFENRKSSAPKNSVELKILESNQLPLGHSTFVPEHCVHSGFSKYEKQMESLIQHKKKKKPNSKPLFATCSDISQKGKSNKQAFDISSVSSNHQWPNPKFSSCDLSSILVDKPLLESLYPRFCNMTFLHLPFFFEIISQS